MSKQWTLTLTEYDENDHPQHETLGTFDSRFHLLQAVQRQADIAYKCHVTEWYFEGDSDNADIAEQVNAQEWMDEELKNYATAKEQAQ